MIQKAKLEILHEVQEGKSKNTQTGPVIQQVTELTESEHTKGTNEPIIRDAVTEVIKNTQEKITIIEKKIIELMIIKGIVDKI